MDQESDGKLRARPTLTAQAVADLAARRAREAAALRANLRRRKEQARARERQRPEHDAEDGPANGDASK
jgi:hypothetical protein